MSHLKAVRDPIDDAIAAADEPAPVQMAQLQVTIASTGRPAAIMVPADASEAELVELCAWMLASVVPSFRARQSTTSRIILPS